MRKFIITEPSNGLRESLPTVEKELYITEDVAEVMGLLSEEKKNVVIVEMCPVNIGRLMPVLVTAIARPEVSVYVVAESFAFEPTLLSLLPDSQRAKLMPHNHEEGLSVGVGWMYLANTHRVFHCNETGLTKVFEEGG